MLGIGVLGLGIRGLGRGFRESRVWLGSEFIGVFGV